MAFTHEERRQLLVTTGIGPIVVQRLEEAGVDSLDKLRQVGVDRAVDGICSRIGSIGWATRRRALARALAGSLQSR